MQEQESHHGDGVARDNRKGKETPILGSRTVMRKETLKALEHRREEVMQERKQSKMQTLGASNPHNNNKDKHRKAARLTGDTVGQIFVNGGVDNGGYDRDGGGPGGNHTDDEASSSAAGGGARGGRGGGGDHYLSRNMIMSSDSSNSKM